VRQAYALFQAYGPGALLAAMALAAAAGRYSAEALHGLLVRPRPVAPLVLPGAPTQAELDRPLSAYEALVQVDEALAERPGVA
jgi:hypothetical protein